MHVVEDKYKQLALASARKHDIQFTFYRLVNGVYTQYAFFHESENSTLIGFKITNGQTTGGFSIGGTICATLELTSAITDLYKVGDKIEIQAYFWTMDEQSGSDYLPLGVFYIDSLTKSQDAIKIIALDAMLRFAKEYKSTISYPSKVSLMLNEIADQSGIGVDTIDIFNDATVASKPIKSIDDKENKYYFTRREVLGYLAGINGGNAYINNVGKIAFSTPRETGYVINWKNVLSQTIGEAELTIDNVVLNKSGTSGSTADDWDANTVQLYAPLDVGDDVSAPITAKLSGVHYESVTIKMQGTGLFEPGDLVGFSEQSYHDMLIMGIVYELSDGFFSETLYSLAQSSAQRQYSGVQNISQNISSGGGGSSLPLLSSYEYISDTSVKVNDTTYTIEKNAAGLITKIIDSADNAIKPKGGDNITDIALHNAVLWATVAARGISRDATPKIDTMPEMGGITGYFVPETLQVDNGLWANYRGTDNIALSGGTLDTGCLHFQPEDYGSFPSVTEPMTIYAVFKCLSSSTQYYTNVITKQRTANGAYTGFDIKLAKNNLAIWLLVGNYGISSYYYGRDWNVVCITRTQPKANLYINGAVQTTSVNCDLGDYGGSFLLNRSITGETVNPTSGELLFKMVAFSTESHSSAQISANSEWLKNKYII